MKKRGKIVWAAAGFGLLSAVIAGICIKEESAVPGGDRSPQEDPSLDLIIASDLHYIAPELSDDSAYFREAISRGDGKVSDYSEEILETFAETVIEASPDALVLTGDLTFNGAEESHRALTQKLQGIEDAGIPVFVLSGNHDLENPYAAEFSEDGYTLTQNIQKEDFPVLYQAFGYDEAVKTDTASASYLAELAPGIDGLFLDVNGVETPCSVPEETLSFLDAALQEEKEQGKMVLAFSHQNLLQHTMFASGYVISNAKEVLSLYQKYGVNVNFSGHLHLQDCRQKGSITEIAQSCLSLSPLQYGVVTIEDGTLEYHTESLDVTGWAEKNGKEDEALSNFSRYAREYFLTCAEAKAEEMLSDLTNTSLRCEMAEYFAEENYEYFAGLPNKADPDNALLHDWEETETGTSLYLKFIEETDREDQNHLTVSLEP